MPPNPEDQPRGSHTALTVAIVVLIIVLFAAVSWVYVTTGSLEHDPADVERSSDPTAAGPDRTAPIHESPSRAQPGPKEDPSAIPIRSPNRRPD